MPKGFAEGNQFDLARHPSTGRMLPRFVVKVMVTKNGQYHITFPRRVAKVIGLVAGSQIKLEYLYWRGLRLMWRNPGEKDFKENL